MLDGGRGRELLRARGGGITSRVAVYEAAAGELGPTLKLKPNSGLKLLLVVLALGLEPELKEIFDIPDSILWLWL